MSGKDIVVGELVDPDPGEPAREGEYIPASPPSIGTLYTDHSDEGAPTEQRGQPNDVNLSDVNRDWVMKRLVKEATDFGIRTRQSGRLKALELIGKELGMFEMPEQDPLNENQRAAREMTHAERQERIRTLFGQLAKDPRKGAH